MRTYQANGFKEKYIQSGLDTDLFLGLGFGQFFMVKVEEMLALMKLPVPPVRVNTHSFIFLTEGVANMSIGIESYTIAQNEGLFVPAGQVFSFDGQDINRGYFCNFSVDFLIEFGQNGHFGHFDFLNAWGHPKVIIDQKTAQYSLQLLKRMYVEYRQNNLRRKVIIQSYLLAVLYEIHSNYRLGASNSEDRSHFLVTRFKELLYQHVKSIHSVKKYASILNVTPNHLNKVLKNKTGKSAKKWLQELLVMEAKVLLFQTDQSIKEIAFELGISDPSYFSRMFKLKTKVSPLEYRKMIEKS